jgi:hypothetical protein
MIEHVDDSLPWVDVSLPGGRVVRGYLMQWRQGPHGGWAPRVVLDVPPGAVQPLDDQDYSRVPRERQYVLATDERVTPARSELHAVTCWSLDKPAPWLRLTVLTSAKMAADMLRFDSTTACALCETAELSSPSEP